MTTNFPGGIDTYTDPVATQTLATNQHRQRHKDLQDAMVAVQATVGVSGSADPASIEYRLAEAAAHAAADAPHAGHATPDSVAAAISSEMASHTTNEAGPHERGLVQTLLRRTTNHALVKTHPTRVCTTVSSAGVPGYTSSLTGSAALSIDAERTDPVTGLSTAKLVMQSGDTGAQELRFDSISPALTPGQPSVWIIPVWLDDAYTVTDSSVSVVIRTSAATAPSGVNYRDYGFGVGMLHAGWNILSCRNYERVVGAAEYGVVGHMPAASATWAQSGATTEDSAIQSFRIRVTAPNRTVHVGSVFLAPANWATAVIVLGFDDVLDTVRTMALPVLEQYGWHATLFPSVQYAGANASYMNMAALRSAIAAGHDVWGHSLTHYDMTSGTQAEKERQARESAAFWARQGIRSAARFGSFPFLAHDATACQIMQAAGYEVVRAGAGRFVNPICPLADKYRLPAQTMELTNAWHSDTLLNGVIERGQIMFAYMHGPVAGGSGINTSPGANQFYVDHLVRWCELVKAAEAAGRCVVLTASELMAACGL